KRVPDGFPSEFPLYKGNKPVTSFTIASQDGTTYFLVFGVKDKPDSILSYYLSQLDKDPWQVEAMQSSDEFTGIVFSRPDNADLEGNIRIGRSELDNSTSIFVSIQDTSRSSKSSSSSQKPFKLGASRPLPAS